MQASIEEKLNDPDTIIREFDTHLKLTDDPHQDNHVVESESEEAMDELNDGDYNKEEEEEQEEFSFVCGGENTSSPIAAEDAFVNGQIKPVYPLFNRELLFFGENLQESFLPMRPRVKKVFVETNEENSNSKEMAASSDQEQILGPYCEWSSRKVVEASAEVCEKSNSTGFSKIWRFRDLTGRSNSDGRDAFVFLNSTHAPPHAPPSKGEDKKSTAEVNGGVIKKKKRSGGGKIKTAVPAHEAYLRSKAKEEEQRRSYLPYRPELVGFFTNVNSGLTKNVHPF